MSLLGGSDEAGKADLAVLAKGGRTNFFGFLLRLAARVPFLIIAGRFYGAESLGRFAYALIVVEFASQLATMGLKRGLAKQLSAEPDKDRHSHIVWDAMVVAAVSALPVMALLFVFPWMMFPNSEVRGLEVLLPITVLALAWAEIALAALAYRHNIRATVTSRAIVEPWVISIVAGIWIFISLDDGLIVAYVFSIVGALISAIWPFIREYGLPRDWRPNFSKSWEMARKNLPVAAADAIEWASRRIDFLIVGAFFSPTVTGIYWAAQQVASLPQKLKTSFDPILGPVISQNVEAGNKKAIAQQVRQVGFWIIAAQAGVALALGIPGMAVMHLVGEEFGSGYIILAVLLGAEVVAAMAAVSESALIYLARHRNMMIGLFMLVLEAAIGVGAVLVLRDMDASEGWQAAGPAIGLAAALGFAAIAKAWLLSGIVNAPVSGWRWPLVWAAAATIPVGLLIVMLPDWGQLAIGVPALLVAFGAVLWVKGFGPEDRELFRKPGAPPPAA